MVLPKLDTATLAPRPPPTFQDKLNRLSATINASGPALGDLFIMTLSMLLGALVIVGAVTGLLYGTGFAIFVLVRGAKKAISLAGAMESGFLVCSLGVWRCEQIVGGG
jgi:hypothetical protein